jgi:hypothetical protein
MNLMIVEGGDNVNGILSPHNPEGTEENRQKLPSG